MSSFAAMSTAEEPMACVDGRACSVGAVDGLLEEVGFEVASHVGEKLRFEFKRPLQRAGAID